MEDNLIHLQNVYFEQPAFHTNFLCLPEGCLEPVSIQFQNAIGRNPGWKPENLSHHLSLGPDMCKLMDWPIKDPSWQCRMNLFVEGSADRYIGPTDSKVNGHVYSNCILVGYSG